MSEQNKNCCCSCQPQQAGMMPLGLGLGLYPYNPCGTGLSKEDIAQMIRDELESIEKPKLEFGVETKRNMLYQGKQVYSQLIDFGYGPNATTKLIPHNIPDVEWIQVDQNYSFLKTPDDPSGFPVHSVAMAASISFASPTEVGAEAVNNLSRHYYVFCLLYTKKSDPVIG